MSMQRVQSSALDSESEPLIPGLPDNVATVCLLRVPVGEHSSCERVSEGWYSIFQSKRRFSTLRKRFHFRDPQLFILAFDQHTDVIHVKALNLTTLSWHTIDVTTNLYLGRVYIRSVSIPSEGVLFVFGGVVCRDSLVNVFLKYDARARGNRWTIIKSMTGAMGSLTAGVIDGKVYLTGLDKNLSDGGHDPVEVFDPEEGTWNSVPNYMRTFKDFYGATVFNGKLLLTYHDDLMTGQIYDPRTHMWENMAGQLRKGLRAGSAVEVSGHLFVLARFVKSGLRFYDARSDSWDIVEGNDLPEGVCLTSPVTSWDGKIYVVKDSLGVVVGNISRITSRSNCTSCSFQVQWEVVVDAPQPYSDLFALTAQVLIA